MAKEAINNAIGIVKSDTLGFFTCRGEVEEAVISKLMEDPPHRSWDMEAMSAKAHPDSADLEDSQFFTLSIVKKSLTFNEYTRK